MKTISAFAVLALMLLVGCAAADVPPDVLVQMAGIGTKIEPFTAETITVSGDKQTTASFDSTERKNATAYVIIGARCPTTSAYVDRFRELEKAYAGKPVELVYVYPNREDTSDAKLAFHKEHKLIGPYIDDRGGRVAKILQARKTSEFILVGKDGTILFRGSIDDSKDVAGVKKRYAAAALDEHLAGKPITTSASQVFA